MRSLGRSRLKAPKRQRARRVYVKGYCRKKPESRFAKRERQRASMPF